MKIEAVVSTIAFILVIVGLMFVFNFNGFVDLDWRNVFNIKTYPK
jgi:hypothetical protein